MTLRRVTAVASDTFSGPLVNELRRALNEGTLRGFRNAHGFPTFKIFRRPGALQRCRSRSIAAIGLNFSPDPLTVRSSVFTFLPYGSDNYFSSDKKAGRLDRTNRRADRRVSGEVDPRPS